MTYRRHVCMDWGLSHRGSCGSRLSKPRGFLFWLRLDLSCYFENPIPVISQGAKDDTWEKVVSHMISCM